MLVATTKHVEVDCHFIREKAQWKYIEVKYASTQDQVADIFKKGLHPQIFHLLRHELMVADRPLRLRGPDDKHLLKLTELESSN